jgi:predicted Zn finger-like uncharacterized protein
MLTQCPHCATVFPIDNAAFAVAGGRVLCGVCEREFDALQHLRQAPSASDPLPRLDPEFAARQGDLFVVPAPAVEVPSFARPKARLGHEWVWPWALLGLCALLGFQIVLAERHTLAMDERWRGGYERLCGWLGCDLPAWRQPARWTLIWREVGPHPSVPDGLLVTAALRNDAGWAQPLPWLELSLADLDGKLVGLRRFSPAEYQTQQSAATVAPGQTASLQLELVDPGKEALAFTLEFR